MRASPLPIALGCQGGAGESSILNHCSREGWGWEEQHKERAELMWMDGMACARTGGCTPQPCTNTLPEQTQDYGWAVECSAWIWTLSESKLQINLLAPHQDCAHAPSITRAGQGLMGRRGPALGPAGSFLFASFTGFQDKNSWSLYLLPSRITV